VAYLLQHTNGISGNVIMPQAPKIHNDVAEKIATPEAWTLIFVKMFATNIISVPEK
jgi:hypothetical protein